MIIRERHIWRGILRFHRGVIRTRRTRARHAGISAKSGGRRNYGGQFGRTTISNAVHQQSFMVHGARSVATSACFGRRSGSPATLSGAKRRTTRGNHESHERHDTQNSQWPRRDPNSPRSWHSFITLRPQHGRVNRTFAGRSVELMLQSP